MDVIRIRRAMELFKQACVMDAASRSAFLETQCGEDADLRRRVDALLAEDSRSMNLLDAPGGGVPMLARQITSLTQIEMTHATESAGAAIPVLTGDYRIMRIIGEGGMGTVYEAEQAIPRRRVALKAIRSGLSSPELVRRFEHEAHILGRLQHPGIAQIYEAGAADAEHLHLAFIAMEYVDGPPLTEYAEVNQLSVRVRVELMIKVCEAVHHAHQRGVIHRDLKPTNILVDATGQPKVLDFGVARAVDTAENTLTTMHTAAGQLVGTVAYMSPEQVAGNPADVDLRSDVYALGVILFRLLAGKLPYELAQQSVPEMGRIIRDTQPDALGTVDRTLRGDLETIVSKALEKEKQRRYPSAAALQSDLQAYLDGAPIEARRDSALYVLRKNLRRYKLAAAAGSVVLILSIGSTVALSKMYHASQRQAEAARLAQIAAQTAEAEQRAEAARARVEARKFDRINQMLQGMLVSAEPNQTQGKDLSVRELLDRTAARVHEALESEPEIEAAMRTTIGDAYANLGLYDPAEQHLREALAIRRRVLGGDHVETATTSLDLANVLRRKDDNGEAFKCCKEAMNAFARVAGRDSVEYARALVLYADLLQEGRDEYTEAERAYREAMAIYVNRYGPVNPYTAAAGANLGALLVSLFRYSEAEPVLRDAYTMALKLHGPDYSVVIMNGHNLAYLLAERRKWTEAEAIVQSTVESATRLYGPEHPETARNMMLLAQVLLLQGEAQRAEAFARQSYEARKKRLPEGHRFTSWSEVLLADALATEGTRDAALEAERLATDALSEYDRQDYTGHWPYVEAQSVQGAALASLGRYAEAEALLIPSLEKLKTMQGLKSRAVFRAVQRIIYLYEAWGRDDLAAEYRGTLDSLPTR